MTPENNTFQEIHSQKTTKLDNYLSSELKLLEKIDSKLSDPRLKELAKKEITDLKDRFETSLSSAIDTHKTLNNDIILESQNARQQLLGEMNSSYVIKDLTDDFHSDLESLSIIEKNYKNEDGYDEFIDLLKSSSQETREKVYTIFGDNNYTSSLQNFIYENEGLPISNQEINTFLNKFRDSIKNDNIKEISEILDDTRELNTYSLKELLYKKDKLLGLKNSIGTGTDIEKKYLQKVTNLDIVIDLYIINSKEQEKSQVEQEKSQVEQEKSQVEQEKSQVEQEKSQVEQETIEEKISEEELNRNIINGIKNDIPGIKNFPYEKLADGETLRSLISQLEKSENDEEFKEISTKLAEFALRGDNLKDIFELASKNKETYEKIHSFFTGVASISKNESLSQAISFYPRTYEKLNSTSPSSLTNSKLSGYFGDTGSVLKDGDKYYKGDTRVDLGTNPPKIEVFNPKTGYSLEVENSVSVEIERNALAKTNIYNEMLELKGQEISLKEKIETLQNLLLDENKLLEYSKQENKSVDELKNQINLVIINLNSELTVITKNYNEKREKYINLQNKSFLKELKEKKESQKQTLKFLSSIGFDLIPQSITDNVINQLNLNTALRAKLGFTMEIDIKNGLLGTDSDANISNITSKEKADFARAFNIMISGEENTPINLDAVLNDRGASISDMATFSAELDRTGLKDPGKANAIMMRNIREFGGETETT